MHHSSDMDADEDDWIIARCSCGWTFGPCPDNETATDVLMDHAFREGIAHRRKAAASPREQTP